MSPRILILSGLYDFSTDLVVLRLQHAGVPYVRLNREQLADHRITLDPLVPELTVHGPAGTHHFGPDLGAVWFRQPVFLRNTPSTPLSLEEQLERVAMDGLSSSALRLSPCSMDEFSGRYLPRGIETISAVCRGQLWLSNSGNAGNQRCKFHPEGISRQSYYQIP